jgi:myo-inositol-1(or 4)-monophosphatase
MFSLGFVVDGTALLGVTYDPFLNRMYCGMKGGGSYCNDVPLQVSQKSLAGEYVALTSSPKRVIRYEKCVAFLSEEGAELTSFSGSVYKMCMVARGSLVGYIEAGINPHDTVAAQVIVEEAGGMVTGFNGQKLDYSRPFKGALFSNGVVHQKLIQSVEDIELRPEDL